MGITYGEALDSIVEENEELHKLNVDFHVDEKVRKSATTEAQKTLAVLSRRGFVLRNEFYVIWNALVKIERMENK